MKVSKLKFKKLKKNSLFIKNSFSNIQLMNDIKLNGLPYFFFKSNSNFLKRSKEIIKFFSILIQRQKIKKIINSEIIVVNIDNFITNPNYLLNFRNQFFTKTFDISGYFCWSWYFDTQDIDSIENKNKFLENVISKGIKAISPTKYNKIKKKKSKFLKPILKFFMKLKMIKPKSRNIKNIYKILMSLGSSNFKKVLLNKFVLTKILNMNNTKNWSVKLKNFINRENRVIPKNRNPYLFLNNKFSQFVKPSKYSIEYYIHRLNTKFYNSNSFRRKLLYNSLRPKRRLSKKSSISSQFFLNRINNFKNKTHPSIFLKKTSLNTKIYLLKTINRNKKQNIKYFFLKKNTNFKTTRNNFKNFDNKIFKKFFFKQNRLLNFSLLKNLYTNYRFLNSKFLFKSSNKHILKIRLARTSFKKFNFYLQKIQKFKNKKLIKTKTLRKFKIKSRINPIFFRKKHRFFNVKSLTTVKSAEALAFWRSKFKRIKKKLNLKVLKKKKNQKLKKKKNQKDFYLIKNL